MRELGAFDLDEHGKADLLDVRRLIDGDPADVPGPELERWEQARADCIRFLADLATCCRSAPTSEQAVISPDGLPCTCDSDDCQGKGRVIIAAATHICWPLAPDPFSDAYVRVETMASVRKQGAPAHLWVAVDPGKTPPDHIRAFSLRGFPDARILDLKGELQ